MGPGNVEQHLTVSGWILIKELHNSLLARFNNKPLSGPGRLISLPYSQLVSQDYMKLNKPFGVLPGCLGTDMQNRQVAHTIFNATRYRAVDDEPDKYAGLVESVGQAILVISKCNSLGQLGVSFPAPTR
ncbi:hypothetical protein PtA15_10A299 [Puccinia triticina]|uniref:Uncharacterized protein n=1 Tax=Puccinia triticina TaxID=208348 RepID=A0ABY7CVD3_9BASI|nr:uncharacterized protein PtA15_10A299 [Puccinia triticina]WAQ88878.1 hypothetical protein PtA15_10A299 [Puccinia triticina]